MCVTEDVRGFMWIGTISGLYKYDGYTFTNYTKSIAARCGSANCIIHGMQKDQKGNIWVACQKAIAIIPAGTDTFQWIKSPIPDGARRIFIDHNGNCWLFFANGAIYMVTPDGQAMHRWQYAPPHEWILDHSVSFYDDSIGHLWLLSSEMRAECFVDVLDYSGRLAAHFETLPDTDKYSDAVTARFNVSGGILKQYVFTKTDVDKYKIPIPVHPVGNYHSCGEGTIYFNDRRGNSIYLTNDSCRLYYGQTGNYADLTSLMQKNAGRLDIIEGIFQSSDNTIWLCTNKGLIKIAYTSARFHNYLSNTLLHQGDAGVSARGMAEDDSGNIWIGTYVTDVNGRKCSLFRISPETGTVSPVVPFYEQGVWTTYFIYPDKNTLWITAEFHCIFQLDRNSPVMKYIKNDAEGKDQFKEQFITNLVKVNDSVFYFGGYDGMGVIYPFRAKHIYSCFSDTVNYVRRVRVNNIIPAENGNYWVPTFNGIYLVNNRAQIIRHYDERGSDGIKLPGNVVYSIYCDKGGSMWAGSKEGLIKIDTTTRRVQVYTEKDGLCNNNVYAVVPDDEGYLWLSTNYGLSRFNPTTAFFTNYYTTDNLPQNEFNHISFLKAKDGRIYFGGLNGVTAFYPKDFDTALSEVPVRLVNASKYDGNKNSIVNQTSIVNATGQVTMQYGDKILSVRVMLPSYKDPSQNRFTYKLDGWDNDWQILKGGNTIAYSFLPPGNYLLRVKGAQPGETWSNKELIINVVVLPAWFKTWWFYTLCVLGAAGIGYLLYRVRLAQVMREHSLRDKISADLHDELGSVLTQISLQSDMLQSGIYTETEKEKELHNISITSRTAITAMSDIVWSIKSDEDKVANLIDRMRDHADLMLQPYGTNIQFTVNHLNEAEAISLEWRQQLFFIFKECINNIVQHSKASHVVIEIVEKDGYFTMSVTNNNCATENRVSKIGGNGLKNMKMRASILKGNIETSANGDTFTVSLKCRSL